MSSVLCSFFWITLQMLLALIGLHSERVTAQFHPYISEFQYLPEYHPSKNPGCVSQWLQSELYQGQFQGKVHRQSFSFEEQIVRQDRPWIEIRAVLRHCMKKRRIGRIHRHSRNCKRKVIISVKINNVGKTNTRDEFVLVDHVLDPVRMRKIRLHNPFVIKVRQEPLLHLYGLRFQGIVNAEAREEVINNQQRNFTGCNDDLKNPTCGKMLINGEPIPFSQGFCCSCESVAAQDAGSSPSSLTKPSHYQENDGANGARNRSASNLSDDSEAQRQIATNEERSRGGAKSGDVRERVTIRNISVVNGPLGAEELPFRKQEKRLRNYSVTRHSNRPSEEVLIAEDGNSMRTPSPMLKNVVFYDAMPSNGKIQAFIDTVYDQTMKERSMKLQNNKHDENSLYDRDRAGKLRDTTKSRQESDSRISNDRYPIYGSAEDYFRNANARLSARSDYNVSKSESRTSSPQFFDRRSNDRYLIHELAADDLQNVGLMKNERDFSRTNEDKEDNHKLLQPGKSCDRLENFSERGKDRSCGTIRLRNAFDHTSTTLLAVRIPEGSEFSRRTLEDVLAMHGDNRAWSDNRSLATTVKFFASSRMPFRSSINYINYAVTPAMELNGFAKDMIALLSNMVIPKTHLSTRKDDREPGNISSSINVSRSGPIEWRNLNAATIRSDDILAEEKRKTENANVSARISKVPAFARSRNLSSLAGIPRLEELPAATARSTDKSLIGEIFKSTTRDSLLSNAIQRFPGFGDLHENREWCRICNSSQPRDMSLKDGYRFRKAYQKPRKLKDPAKFYKDKSIAGNLKRSSFGKSLSELISKRASPDFKRERFYEGRALKREKRFQRRLQRHLRAEKRALDSIQPDELNDEDSRRKIQSFVDQRAQMTYPKRKTLENRRNENPVQVISKLNESYRKELQPEKNDNPFICNENGKDSNIDKRIEEKFASISNVLKEDSTEKIIQATFQAFTKNENVSRHADEVGILKIHDGLEDNSRVSDKFNDPSIAVRDEATHDYSTESIGMRQRSTMILNDDLVATAEFMKTNNEVVTASSPITWRNNYREFTFHESEGKLSNTIIGPFLSLSVRRKTNDSRKANSTKRTSSVYQDVPIEKQTGFFMREFSSMTPRSGNASDYFEVTAGAVATLSSSWTSFKQATVFPEKLNNRSEQEGAKNARFLEFNNSSWMIAGNSARPRDPSIAPRLSLLGSDSLTESKASRNEKGEQARYTENSLAEDLKDTSANEESSQKSLASQEKDEIAKLVDRIVRQYAAFTPIMPGMPIFEITEPETLPPEADTTTTVLATTTRLTDKAFRPPIRLLYTTPLSREMHEEISLDETTFAEETEGTTDKKITTVKWRPPAERYRAKSTPPRKAQKSPNKAEKSEKPKERITGSNKNLSIAEAENETWHHTTARQQLVASNGRPQKNKVEKKKQNYESKVKHHRDVPSSAWPLPTAASSGATNEVAQTRSKRAGLVRGSADRTSSVFCDYEGEDKEDRRSGRRTAANKSAGSPDMMEPNGLRSGIEKRLAGELDYPATRGSSRRSRENGKRIQQHDAALENIVMRDSVGTVNKRMDEQDARGSLKNYTSLKLHCAKDDAGKLNESPSSGDYRKDISASIDASDQQKDSSGSMYKKTEMDRRTEKDAEKHASGEPVAVDIVRKIALNLSENARSGNADDSSNGPAKPREESATTRISLDVKSPGDQDKTRETDTVICGAKLMTANDKDEMHDLGIAAKNVDEMISSAVAKQLGRKDARKINENPADVRRVSSIGKGYLRRPRGNVHDIIRRMIGKLYREKSSSASVKNTVGSEEGIDRSVDWHRSGRRLLSSEDSSYIEKDDDEYYQDEESDTENAENNLASDNKARSDGLSSFGNQRGPDRKLAAEMQRLDENIEAAEIAMPQEKLIRDTAIIPDNVQEAKEGTLSSAKKMISKNAVSEGRLSDSALKSQSNLSNDNISEVFAEEKKSIAESAGNNNIRIQKKSLDKHDNGLRISQAYEEVDEEPLSFREETNKDNLGDESLYGTQSTTSDTRKITNYSINRDLSSIGAVSRNVDPSQTSTMKNEGSIKISLSGKIQVNGGSNQTPMVISFDAVPEEALAIPQFSHALTTVNLSLNNSNSNLDLTPDPLSMTDHANDKTNDSLGAICDENRKINETNANRDAIKSGGKFSDSRKNEETTKEASPLRIEKRLDNKSNMNSKMVKQIFLTDYSKSAIASKTNKMNTGKIISKRVDDSGTASLRKNEVNFRSSTSPVHFPDILGSILINNGTLKDPNATVESQCQFTAPNRSKDCDRSNKTIIHVIPLVRIQIQKPNVSLERNETRLCSSENITYDGCWRISTDIQKLTETITPISHDFTTTSRDTTKRDWYGETTQSLMENAITDKMLPLCHTSCKCDKSVDAIRVRNMMAIVRFMMKLLRMTEDEEPPCRKIHINETRMEDILVDTSTSRDDERLTGVIDWYTRTTVVHKELLPLDGTFAPLTEAPPHLTTISDQLFKDEKTSTPFKLLTEEEVYVTFSTPRSFLFYKPRGKSPFQKNLATNVNNEPTDAKQNSNLSINDANESSKRNKFRPDNNKGNHSTWMQNQNQSCADQYDKQAVATNSLQDNAELRSSSGYWPKNSSAGFRWSKLSDDVASNDTIRPMFPRDTSITRNAALGEIAAAKRETSKHSKPKQAKKTKISDRRVKRTKLLNSSTRKASSGDWIGKATRQVPVDKKCTKESHEARGGARMLEKVALRHARNEINCPADPNLGRDDSLKIDGRSGSKAMTKHSTNDTLSGVSRGLNSSKKADSSGERNATRRSPIFSSLDDNARASKRSSKEITSKHANTTDKKRNVKHREVKGQDFRKSDAISSKQPRDANSGGFFKKWRSRRKKKKKKKKKRKKPHSHFWMDESRAINQRLFKRRLLMMLLEPELEYDADGWTGRHNAEDFRESAREGQVMAESEVDFNRLQFQSGQDYTGCRHSADVDPSRLHIRGGQDCQNYRHPPNVDITRYLQSAHCLRFSDLWYSVYELDKPIVEHVVYLQVYEKHLLMNGSTYWKDLTGGSVVRLGTFNRRHRGSKNTIAFAYREMKMPGRKEREPANLNVDRDRLLVPSSVTSKGSGYSVEGESDEYLIIPASSINVNGNECDKAGVGFAAFAKQPDRCGHVRGTCLKNQPLAYRKHDMEARAAGRPGCYFLSNFASVPSEPIKYSANASGSREFLALEYHSLHVSAIDIEVRTYYGMPTEGPLYSGCIKEVHVDNTVRDHTVITVVVINTGSISASYRLKIVNCPNGLPESWVNATYPEKIILPRQHRAVRLKLYGQLPIDEFRCSVRLLNDIGEPLAIRNIRIRKMDECSCILHCLCVCEGDPQDLHETCQPMSPELYRDTGCYGIAPTPSLPMFSYMTIDVLLFISFLILLLIFMGLLKWFIGLFVPIVGRWGLDFLLGNVRMSEYYERELKYKCVVTDDEGAPVHPDTRKRSVRICSRKMEFFLNAIFFLIFPLAVCFYYLKKPFRRPARRRPCVRSSESKISLMSGGVERPRTICVSTYGHDSQGSKMEAEDTKYVMDELRRSEESLRSHSRNKVSGSNKEAR